MDDPRTVYQSIRVPLKVKFTVSPRRSASTYMRPEACEVEIFDQLWVRLGVFCRIPPTVNASIATLVPVPCVEPFKPRTMTVSACALEDRPEIVLATR